MLRTRETNLINMELQFRFNAYEFNKNNQKIKQKDNIITDLEDKIKALGKIIQEHNQYKGEYSRQTIDDTPKLKHKKDFEL